MVGTKPGTVIAVLYQLLYQISFLDPSKLCDVLLVIRLLILHGMQGVSGSNPLGSIKISLSEANNLVQKPVQLCIGFFVLH